VRKRGSAEHLRGFPIRLAFVDLLLSSFFLDVPVAIDDGLRHMSK